MVLSGVQVDLRIDRDRKVLEGVQDGHPYRAEAQRGRVFSRRGIATQRGVYGSSQRTEGSE
jgi:hypothetical protein